MNDSSSLNIDWSRACPRAQRAALVLLLWGTKGVTVCWRDQAGKLWGCRDISFGVDHEACLNAWTEDAIKQGFKIEDRRGFPKFTEWMREQAGANWCVAPGQRPGSRLATAMY